MMEKMGAKVFFVAYFLQESLKSAEDRYFEHYTEILPGSFNDFPMFY